MSKKFVPLFNIFLFLNYYSYTAITLHVYTCTVGVCPFQKNIIFPYTFLLYLSYEASKMSNGNSVPPKLLKLTTFMLNWLYLGIRHRSSILYNRRSCSFTNANYIPYPLRTYNNYGYMYHFCKNTHD